MRRSLSGSVPILERRSRRSSIEAAPCAQSRIFARSFHEKVAGGRSPLSLGAYLRRSGVIKAACTFYYDPSHANRL